MNSELGTGQSTSSQRALPAMHALAALPCLQQAPDLVHLCSDRSSEPATGQYIVKQAQWAMAEVELFDVVDPGPSVHFCDLEPSVETARYTMLDDDVDAGWTLPRVARYHRTFEFSEKLAVLTSNHPVWKVRKLRHPDHLRVRLDVLRWIKDKIKCLIGSHAPGNRRAFASNHSASSQE